VLNFNPAMPARAGNPRWTRLASVVAKDMFDHISSWKKLSSPDSLQHEVRDFLNVLFTDRLVDEEMVGLLLVGAYVLLEADVFQSLLEETWRAALVSALLKSGTCLVKDQSKQQAPITKWRHFAINHFLKQNGSDSLLRESLEKHHWPCAAVRKQATSRLMSKAAELGKRKRRTRRCFEVVSIGDASTDCGSDVDFLYMSEAEDSDAVVSI